MSPRRTLAIVGILIIIIPFLGVPGALRTFALFVLGVFIIAYASVLHTRYFSTDMPTISPLHDQENHIDSISGRA